jgi:hypothetical protein
MRFSKEVHIKNFANLISNPQEIWFVLPEEGKAVDLDPKG